MSSAYESEGTRAVRDVDLSRAHPARMYDLFLGGKNHYPADREAGEAVIGSNPHIRTAARANRGFLTRVVEYLASEGVAQFLDIGTGFPVGTDNVHDVAQRIAPRARVVYADNDPIVLAHARALLRSSPEGRTAVVEADLRDPAHLLENPQVREVLDFDQPIAVMHFVSDRSGPHGIVRQLVEELPSGSYLALSHATGDLDPEMWSHIVDIYRGQGHEAQVRSLEETERFFDGLDLLGGSVDLVTRWGRPDELTRRTPAAHVACYGGMGRKP